MAIRKPTPPQAKSAAMAEMLSAAVDEAKFKTGSVVEGTVTALKGDDVFVDIGYKSAGAVPLAEFGEGADPKVGDKTTVMIVKLEDDKTGMIELSKRRADEKIRWEKILDRYVEGCVVTGTIKSAVRGGLIVQVDDVEAFLPGSQVEITPVKELEPYVGQTFDFKVIKISNERRNLIVSRRELIEGTLAEKRAELLATLQKGELRKGRVKNITDFGAFIDLDGIDGLLHITDMSWGRIKHPSEMLKVGQEVEVMVLDVDRDRERISLGLKQTTQNPWDTIQERFPVGSRVQGKVVNLAAYGAFVEIAPGIEGLVHISEFSWTKRVARASDMLSIGDEVQVVVLSIDVENQKIALGIRQTQANPWDTVQDRFPVGSKVKGKVRNFTAYGAFVELEEGIDGMIHVSDMSWTRLSFSTSTRRSSASRSASSRPRPIRGPRSPASTPSAWSSRARSRRSPRSALSSSSRTAWTVLSTSRRSATSASRRSRTLSTSARRLRPAWSRSTAASAASACRSARCP